MSRTRNLLAALAIAAIGGAAAYVWQEKQTPEARFRPLLRDKQFELREYDALTVAQVTGTGDRRNALKSGFRRLADYIFAKDRPGEEIAMTVPVLQEKSDNRSGWRTRFVMPQGCDSADLPPPPPGIEIEDVEARRLAAIRFSGNPDDGDIARREAELRHWCEVEGLQPIGDFEYAYYSSPMIPPLLRRNEVMVPVSRGA